jgi:hypothetical protein
MQGSQQFVGQIAKLMEGNITVMVGVVSDTATVSGKWNGDSCTDYVVDGIRWANVPENDCPNLRNFSVVHTSTDIGGHGLHIDGEKVCQLHNGFGDGRYRLKFLGDSKLVR